MKILLALSHSGAFRFFPDVVRRLEADGHTVGIAYGPPPANAPVGTGAGLRKYFTDSPGSDLGASATGSPLDFRRWLLEGSRALLSYATYQRPGHPSPHLAQTWANTMPLPLRALLYLKPFRWAIATAFARGLFRLLERLTPPPNAITTLLATWRPDVVVASPFVMARPIEVDYVKAAKRLGIPTGVIVMSWDHLTTKGTVHVLPDKVFVWNEQLANEARLIHGIPSDRLSITGAPVFDFWFDTAPSLSRDAFCREVGLDPARPYIAYVGSSFPLAAHEPVLVQKLAAELQKAPATRDVAVLVRPHPHQASVWEHHPSDLVVWPAAGAIPELAKSQRNYVDTIHHAAAVVGLNTSALVEGAIAGRPCISIVLDEFYAAQTGRAHFRHLLAAEYLEVARSVDEVSVVLARILGGNDSKSENRRRFVKQFVRPAGLNLPAAQVLAEHVAALAESDTHPVATDSQTKRVHATTRPMGRTYAEETPSVTGAKEDR